MSQPFAGIVIADFSHVMAGPYASHLLRLMGAEVIKVEPKGGDNFRNYGADRRHDGMAPAFIAANAGKKSIALDLKDSVDAATARAIVGRADVLLENFRPGVIARLGLGYDTVRTFNPDIVYCSVSGYGQDGPQRDWPAIDNIVQATSGMMMLSGDDGAPPVRVGFPIVDTLTGQSAALAIAAALFRRQQGGGGSYIDVSMLDASLAFMTSALTPFLVTGQAMPRMGNTGYSGLPTATLFDVRNGRQVSLGVVQPGQFTALVKYLGREDWLTDPRFMTPDLRRTNFAAMHAELAHAVADRDGFLLEAELSAQGVPCGLVRRVDEATAMARPGALLSLPIAGRADDGTIQIPNAGFRMDPDGPGVDESAPHLDQHREAIIEWLRTTPPN